MPSISLQARYGTWYRSDEPNTVFYNLRSYIAVRSSGPVMHSYVFFNNPFTFPGATVKTAKLYLRLQGGTTNSGTRSVSVQRVAKGLSFTQMTYNNRPTVFSGPTSSKSTTGPLGADHQFEIDVTASMQGVANGDPFFGFIVTTTAPFVMQLHGALTAYAPSLFVSYSYPPMPPQDLSPAGGRVVALTRPTLSFSYYDANGDEKISGLEIQTAPGSANFGSPAWTSGQVLTTRPSLDLAATTFPARSIGQQTWWRVRARSSSGVWSDWSTPVPFTYRPHASLTILNPVGVSFADPTPPIVWTSTGTTKRWRASFNLIENGALKQIAYSGNITGAGGTWTPTSGASKAGGLHRIIVNTFDDYDREATPGDPGYAQISVERTFTPSATIAAPTALVARDNYPRPGATLEWKRTNTPDHWQIYRNGQPFTRVSGPELLASYQTYRFQARAGGGRQKWSVRAVVNGEVSALSNEVEHEGEVQGVWLFDDEGRAVCVQDDRTHDMEYAEVSAIHEPLGASYVVVRTQALRGYEGTISGLITSLKGQQEEPEKWRENLLLFKSPPGRTFEMVIEGESFPVVLRKISVKQAPKRRRTWLVSFEFFQQGGTPFDTSMGG